MIPLTPALSPMGRGSPVAQLLTVCSPSLRHHCRIWRFPLPFGERVRVRGTMPQEPALTAEVRILRQAATPAEVLLWQALRQRRLGGLKFRRCEVVTTPSGAFVAAFLCAERRLIVDLSPADNPGVNDLHRQAAFRATGWRVVGRAERGVLLDLPAVLRALGEACKP